MHFQFLYIGMVMYLFSNLTTYFCALNCTFAQVIMHNSIFSDKWFPSVDHLHELDSFEWNKRWLILTGITVVLFDGQKADYSYSYIGNAIQNIPVLLHDLQT